VRPAQPGVQHKKSWFSGRPPRTLILHTKHKSLKMDSSSIKTPDVRAILAPLLTSLPGDSVSNKPPAAVLPVLSPILRQRVQLLSSSSNEPWIRLLSYDTAKAAKLPGVVQTERLEPHPASGEIEMDWDSEIKLQYRRVDAETLQALAVLEELELFFRLVYCTGDQEGGGDGWRVGEVSIADKPSPFASFDGRSTVDEAEKAFKEIHSKHTTNGYGHTHGHAGHHTAGEVEDDDDDDD